jgi:hypothetical protein
VTGIGIRTSYRFSGDPAISHNDIGFRCAVSPAPTTINVQPTSPANKIATPSTQEANATSVPVVETTQSSTQSGSPAYYQIYFVNKSNVTGQFAVHYKNLDNVWVTDGWWVIGPGETVYAAMTKNAVFYDYGEQIGGGNYYWGGTDTYQPIKGSKNSYGFKEDTVDGSDWKKYTVSFDCP